MPKTKNCWRSFGAPARAGLSAHRNTSDAETLWQRLLVSAWWTVNWIFGAHLLSFWSAGTVSFRQIKIVLFYHFLKWTTASDCYWNCGNWSSEAELFCYPTRCVCILYIPIYFMKLQEEDQINRVLQMSKRNKTRQQRISGQLGAKPQHSPQFANWRK